MKYTKTIVVDMSLAEKIRKYLSEEPSDRESCQNEEDTISLTASFDNGVEIDVKCCGVKYIEGESNMSWSEAVLFDNYVEQMYTEPDCEFFGEWMFVYKKNIYIVNVVPADEVVQDDTQKTWAIY